MIGGMRVVTDPAITQQWGVNDALVLKFKAGANVALEAQVSPGCVEQFGELGGVGLVAGSAGTHRGGAVNAIVRTGDIRMARGTAVGVFLTSQDATFIAAVRIVAGKAFILGKGRMGEGIGGCLRSVAECAQLVLVSHRREGVLGDIRQLVAAIASIHADRAVQEGAALDARVAVCGHAPLASDLHFGRRERGPGCIEPDGRRC